MLEERLEKIFVANFHARFYFVNALTIEDATDKFAARFKKEYSRVKFVDHYLTKTEITNKYEKIIKYEVILKDGDGNTYGFKIQELNFSGEAVALVI